jgi:hypothetical protein
MMLRFQRDLTAARQQLSRVPASRVKLAVRFGMIRLDLNRNGKTESGEELWRIYGQVNRAAPRVRPVQASQFSIAIDEGDVHWLHGYCHLLGAITEIILAHDTSEIFYRSGFMVFPHIDSPYKDFAKNGGPIQGIINEVTLIHLINLPVREPQRMERARRHLLEVIRTGRLSWQAIRAETDNDREWIPNSEQTALSPAMRVTEPMIKGWLEFQDEAELLLEGKLLAPFWRGDNKKLGVNVKRVFQEPRRLDLILWAQGTAAAPYLEEGELTKPETWERFQTLFGGQFLRFAVWFN